MSSPNRPDGWPPLPIGAFLRFALGEVRSRIYEGVVADGFTDVRRSHVTLFRWPGPDGRRPTQVAADAGISKQRVNDLLRDLERLGYLDLTPDPTDSRARIIRLTERGRSLHRVAVETHAGLEEEWAAAVGQQPYEQMRATLMKLTTLAAGDLTTDHPQPRETDVSRRRAPDNHRSARTRR